MQVVYFDLFGLPSNAYVLETAHNIFIIDTNVADVQEEMGAALAACDLSKPVTILNTHGHWDHTSLNGYLKEHYGAAICAHAGARELQLDPEGQFDHIYGRFLSLHPENNDILRAYTHYFRYPAPPDRVLTGGEVFADQGFRLRVVPTPGHSQDSLSFYEEVSGVLFGGDSVQGNGQGANGPYYCFAEDYLRSLHTIADLHPSALMNAHVQVEGAAETARFLDLSMAAWRKIDEAVRAALPLDREALPALAQRIAERFGWRNGMHVLSTVTAHTQIVR